MRMGFPTGSHDSRFFPENGAIIQFCRVCQAGDLSADRLLKIHRGGGYFALAEVLDRSGCMHSHTARCYGIADAAHPRTCPA